MRRDLTGSDAALVRATARRIAWQSAALVALVVLALSALAIFVALRQQHAEANSLLRQATATADDVGDPPASTWLAIRRNGETRATQGIPPPLPLIADLDRVAATGGSVVRDVHTGDHEFRVRTGMHGSAVVQAALDLSSQHQERRHLVAAMFTMGVVGLLLAGTIGLVMGRRAVRPLARALALQRDFVADASHELRTPLTLLSTRAQLLSRALREADVPPEVRADSAGVVSDTARMVAIVDDLLLSADGGDAGEQSAIDLFTLCTDLTESARAFAKARGIALTAAEITPPAPIVRGNEVALRRALTALLDNALAHTPRGGSVTLTASSDREGCLVDIADTGPGIDPTTAGRVFERFHSGSQQADRRSYGLGLSLASGVAARHHGSLSIVDSGPGGTTFRLRLPAATDELRPGSF